MTTQYFDLVSGSNANSGLNELLPKQHADTDGNGTGATMSAGQIALFKRGQNHPIASNFIFRSNMRWASYGSGTKPKLQKTSTTGRLLIMADSVDVSGVVIQDLDVDANGQLTSAAVLELWAFGAFTTSNIQLLNLELFGSPDHVGLGIGTDATGQVTNVKADSCIFRDNANHGAMSGGNSSYHLYTLCKALRNGFAVGAHGFSSFGTDAGHPSKGITWKLCESAFNFDYLRGGEGTAYQFDNFCTFSAALACLAHHNQGAAYRSNANAGGNRVVGSIGYANDYEGASAINSPNFLLANSVLDKNCRIPSGPVYAEVQYTAGSTGGKVINVILVGDLTVTRGIDADGTSTGLTVTTNCIYNFATPTGGAGAPTVTGTISTDPLFVNAAARNYRLQSASPCIGAGTWPGSKIVTQDGFTMSGPYDVGAYWSKGPTANSRSM
jgi:hypothetical protein